MDRSSDSTDWRTLPPGSGPGRGVRVVLAWYGERPDPSEFWKAPADGGSSPLTTATAAEYWSRPRLRSTALAPSKRKSAAAIDPPDDDFDPRRLVKHEVTVLDLGRSGLHLSTRVRPRHDRDLWIGIGEDGGFVWSKVVLRSVSAPIAGVYLARCSFAGSCPYELIRRAILGRPPSSAPDRDKAPDRP